MKSSYLRNNNQIARRFIDQDWRVLFLQSFFGVLTMVVVIRLFNLQISNYQVYSLLASEQHEIYKKILPVRGKIFIKDEGVDDYFSLATNKNYDLVYVQPKLITNPEEVAQKIYPLLFKEEISRQIEEVENINIATDENYLKLLSKLSKKDDPYEPLKHKVEKEVIDQLDVLNISGINYTPEEWRYYPDGYMGSQMLGYARMESDKSLGQYGLEGYFDNVLAGKQGYLRSENGARGNFLVFGNIEFIQPVNGSDIYLTIDRAIQNQACLELNQAFVDYQIEEGAIIVMQPKTGAILAMCGYPSFDPNKYNQVEDISLFNNPATLHAYEPGSIFKPITMAMAIDLGKVSPQTTYNDEGFVKVDKFTIRNVDSRPRGLQTMTQVLEQSLNTGAIFAARQVGDESFLDYAKKFGFGKETGIEQRESVGNIKSLENLNDVYTFTASFGQGITVTPIQMITAFSAVVNGGTLMKPYLVDKIINQQKQEVKTEPQSVQQVISFRTSSLLKAMLVSVIENGHSKRVRIDGYLLGGKTGTAQVSDEKNGGYHDDVFNHSFIGFGPMEDPQFVILVKLNNPKDARFADQSAAPIFRKLASFILKYKEIPPTE